MCGVTLHAARVERTAEIIWSLLTGITRVPAMAFEARPGLSGGPIYSSPTASEPGTHFRAENEWRERPRGRLAVYWTRLASARFAYGPAARRAAVGQLEPDDAIDVVAR